jgi:WD40 repeat protein
VIQLSDGRVCSGSADNTIKVWNCSSGECLKTLSGHTYAVWCLLALNNHNNLCSGSNDNSIKIWDISSGQCTKTFSSRTGIRAPLKIEQNIVSGSDDKTFKVWQLSSGQ